VINSASEAPASLQSLNIWPILGGKIVVKIRDGTLVQVGFFFFGGKDLWLLSVVTLTLRIKRYGICKGKMT
jgi:hypothetical protein